MIRPLGRIRAAILAILKLKLKGGIWSPTDTASLGTGSCSACDPQAEPGVAVLKSYSIQGDNDATARRPQKPRATGTNNL